MQVYHLQTETQRRPVSADPVALAGVIADASGLARFEEEAAAAAAELRRLADARADIAANIRKLVGLLCLMVGFASCQSPAPQPVAII